jgi:hypothetical protein
MTDEFYKPVNGLPMSGCAEPDTPLIICRKLQTALGELKQRLQARYERRLSGERVRKAIQDAEAAAWQTSFPHLFLPDLVEDAMEHLANSSSELGNEETTRANAA